MPTTSPDVPLRLGILGAARICDEAIVGPAQASGHRVVAVAARDRARAEAFAAERGIERVLGSYQDVIDDPEVDVIYNPLPNSLHAEWNSAAARAGKHVLAEKPSARDADEARAVLGVVQASGVAFLEGFHYLHHPVTRRLLELLETGELGEFRRLEVDMYMPAPAAADPRWSGVLAGGALMDLGCYGLHAARQLASFAGGEPVVQRAESGVNPRYADVDEWFTADLGYPSGAAASVRSRMFGADWRMTLDLVGSAGSAHARNFVKANQDDRVVVEVGGVERVERLGSRSSYTYQLDVFADHVRNRTELPVAEDDPVRNMQLIDDCRALAS